MVIADNFRIQIRNGQPVIEVVRLDAALAHERVEDILSLLSRIQGVSYTPEAILAESKQGVALLGKWLHSVAVMDTDADRLVGVLLTHERIAESKVPYDFLSYYLSGLAVADRYEGIGIGGLMLEDWLDTTAHKGYVETGGGVCWTLQTNSAAWNAGVVDFYVRRGFQVIGTKEYPNRVDLVMKRIQ